ncbi:MAG TPA: DUF928 domain-containing protein [Tepidisphaeraceae bacterium]
MIKTSFCSVATLMLIILCAPSASQAQPTTAPTTMPATRESIADAQPIRYQRPPRSGAPRGATSGGTRGNGDDLPQPFLFADYQQPGLTISPKPVFYFLLPKPTTNRITFSLSDPDTQTTLARVNFDQGAPQAGIVRVALGENDPPLKPGVEYIWSISVRSAKGGNAANADARAVVVYQPMPELDQKLSGLDKSQRAQILAENGIWYDMIANVSEAIDASPDNPYLRSQRERLLLEQNQNRETTIKALEKAGP